MVSPELLGYIRTEIKNNAARDQIRSRLMLQGWTSGDVGEAFAIIEAESPVRIPVPAPGPVVTASPMVMSYGAAGESKTSTKYLKTIFKTLLVVILITGIAYAIWMVRPLILSSIGTKPVNVSPEASVPQPLTDESTKAQVKAAYLNLKALVNSGDFGKVRAYIQSVATTPYEREIVTAATDTEIKAWIDDTKTAYAAISEASLSDGSAIWVISGDGNEVVIQKGFTILLFNKTNGEWR